MKDAAQNILKGFCAKNLRGIKDFVSTVEVGVPYKNIVKFTNKNEMDIIVIGSFGKTGIDHIFFGSTTKSVLRKVSCPVLKVHPAE